MSENNELEIKEMLTLVLTNLSEMSIQVRANHNTMLDLYGEFAGFKLDNIQIKEVLFGKDKQGGGLVDRVKTLELYGRFPPWLIWLAVGTFCVLTVASICVILLTAMAVRGVTGGG